MNTVFPVIEFTADWQIYEAPVESESSSSASFEASPAVPASPSSFDAYGVDPVFCGFAPAGQDVVENSDLPDYSVEALRKRAEAGEQLDCIFFWSHHEHRPGITTRACLSQWYPSPFVIDGARYSCAEQFMMAEKARMMGNEECLRKIMATDDPREMKALGRAIPGFDHARWDLIKLAAVRRASIAKFSQNPKLLHFLEWTGDRILVEASPLDKVWGIGLRSSDERVKSPASWLGTNYLGIALMQTRDWLLHQLPARDCSPYCDPDLGCFRLIDGGDAATRFEVGRRFEEGIGLPTDLSRAILYYTRAAEEGFAEAQIRLGILYRDGIKLPQNFSLSARWLTAAAEQEHPDALYYLAESYQYGLGVDPDLHRAELLFKEAECRGCSFPLPILDPYYAPHGFRMPRTKIRRRD